MDVDLREVVEPLDRIAAAVARVTDSSDPVAVAHAVMAVDVADLDAVFHPVADLASARTLGEGTGASPGIGSGHAYFSAEAALDAADRGERVVLVAALTSPADEPAMRFAEAVVTARGGRSSHSAVVARSWGIPAVCGLDCLEFVDEVAHFGGERCPEGTPLTVDGNRGLVLAGAVAPSGGVRGDDDMPAAVADLLDLCEIVNRGRVRVDTNADSPEDLRRAIAFGASGVGLCRTEHQFVGERLPLLQSLILDDDEGVRADSLDRLVRLQREDFAAMLEVAGERSVTFRLLDPPAHEFLPQGAAPPGAGADELRRHEAASAWREHNPMLGTRGVRLGVIRPEIYQVQIRALVEAAAGRLTDGVEVAPRLLVPFVTTAAELDLVLGWTDAEIRTVAARTGIEVDLPVGVMVEVPRVALDAASFASRAAFLSFGTNDLTQLTLGLAREDVDARVVRPYVDRGLLASDPFVSLDTAGVGRLIQWAIGSARDAVPEIELAACGEHAADPTSVALLVAWGIKRLSCSPFRVATARLAAAQALVRLDGGPEGVADALSFLVTD